ncbi:hypothetical protein GCM10011390_34870 [Aureimonas endophytica]|uniref:Bacterial transcriptional activator domain-containing protein n=1 Tax=Aureimonas endophytica TaxID=2027858 RepID=A0A916ZU26_9HYPH|nr:BTAD domain-containing putative transcriptional regulator [Aureimonas endophytica]GGE12715.1 hypothetical protein GCM10011390_34870 [Aureimonas endophytica]
MPQSPTDSPLGRIDLFGRPTALVGGSPVVFPEKAFMLVALLAFAAGRDLDRASARELLWEEVPPARRAGNLRQLLLRLGQLEPGSPVRVTPEGGLRLAEDRWRVDAVALLSGAVAPGAVDGRPLLEGVAAKGDQFEDWLRWASRRANEQRGAALRAALDAAALDPAARLDIAERLLALEPLDETGHRHRLTAHAEAGDLAAARRAWLDCRARLRDELGIEPSPDIQALAARLGLEGAAVPPSASVAALSDAPERGDRLGIPTVIVMPPALLPGNELLDRFGLVLLEEITLGLSQFGSFRVIAAHTSWQLARRAPGSPALGPAPFGEAPRPDYAVTVGIRSSGEPLNASCRLTKLSTGEVLWAVDLEISAANLQASLTDIVRRTVGSLAALIERAEGRLSLAEAGATGYRLYLEGKRSIGATGLEPLRAARKWFRLAVKRCDEFSAALAGLSRTLSMEWLVRGMTDRELLTDALQAAQRAEACDPGSGRALRELGFANLYLRRHDDSLACFAAARARAPNDADLLADYADAVMHDGQPERALELMRAAKALNPLGPDYYRWIEASILYRLEDYDGAVAVLQPIADRPSTARLLAATCAMAGDLTAARGHAARVRENYPAFRVDDVWQIIPDRRPADLRQFAAGLRGAGLD